MACGRGLPESTGTEQVALGAARAVPGEPSAGCGVGALPALDGARHRLVVDGEERTYLIDAPVGAAGQALPVVLSFHGFRSTAWRHRWWTGWGTRARRDGFIAVHPEGHEGVELLERTGRGWDIRPGETRDATFVRALLDRLEQERCIDRRRAYATGMSNGGFFANLLGCQLGDRLAAIAPVSGAVALGGCQPAPAPPVLLIFGRADRVVPARLMHGARDWWARIAGCGPPLELEGCAYFTECTADVVYCEGPHGHRWPGDATERIWRFFQAHPRA